MNTLSVIFVGTGAFGAKTLEALAEDKRFKIPLVITGKSKPQGRGLKFQESEVQQIGKANNLIIHEVDKIDSLSNKIMQEKPDFLLVVAFGEIIKNNLLKIPKFGSVNIHASLLPKYRGASPIHEALLRGDSKTGITWTLMNEKLDAGGIIGQEVFPIAESDDFPLLFKKLSEFSAEKTPEILTAFAENELKTAQSDSDATYCRKIKKADGEIHPEKETAISILNKIRAYNPWPGCSIFLNGKRLKIIQAELSELKIDSGAIETKNNQLLLGTTIGTLRILRVQPESKREMPTEDFLKGYRQ